jgi:hypothetical protein
MSNKIYSITVTTIMDNMAWGVLDDGEAVYIAQQFLYIQPPLSAGERLRGFIEHDPAYPKPRLEKIVSRSTGDSVSSVSELRRKLADALQERDELQVKLAAALEENLRLREAVPATKARVMLQPKPHPRSPEFMKYDMTQVPPVLDVSASLDAMGLSIDILMDPRFTWPKATAEYSCRMSLLGTGQKRGKAVSVIEWWERYHKRLDGTA